jgi:hypothetical protein
MIGPAANGAPGIRIADIWASMTLEREWAVVNGQAEHIGVVPGLIAPVTSVGAP